MSNSRRGPTYAAHYLRPSQRLEFLGRGSRQRQLTLVRENEQAILAQTDERAKRRGFGCPFYFSGREVKAAKVGFGFRLPIESINVISEQNPRAQMIMQNIFLVNHLGSIQMDSQQRTASGETRDEHFVALNQGIGIVRVVTGFK